MQAPQENPSLARRAEQPLEAVAPLPAGASRGDKRGSSLRSRVVVASSVLLWLALATWRLGSVPGMSMDEAWSILSARGEWAPHDPLSGMTAYSGPLPVLLLDLLGTDAGVWVLRGASVLANAALLVVIARLLRRSAPARAARGWALPLLATTPVWLITLRTGIEVTMFTPLLSVLGLYLVLGRTRASSLSAGVVWGLSVYSHLIGLAFPVAVAVAWLAVYRRRLPLGWWPLLLGLALGLAPRLVAMALFRDESLTGYAARYALWPAIKDLRWLPKALWETWHGETVYLRYVGRVAVEIWPYGLLAVGFFVPWVKCPRDIPKPVVFTLLAAVGSAVLTTIGAPYIAVRFLVVPLLGLSTFLVLLGASAVERDARWGGLVRATAYALGACQLFYALVDFYVPWQQQNLGVTTFFLGARSKRTSSWAYLPKDTLARELLALSPLPEQILTIPPIERALRVLLRGANVSVKLASDAEPGKRSVFVDFDRAPLVDPVCMSVGLEPICFGAPQPLASYYVIYRAP